SGYRRPYPRGFGKLFLSGDELCDGGVRVRKIAESFDRGGRIVRKYLHCRNCRRRRVFSVGADGFAKFGKGVVGFAAAQKCVAERPLNRGVIWSKFRSVAKRGFGSVGVAASFAGCAESDPGKIIVRREPCGRFVFGQRARCVSADKSVVQMRGRPAVRKRIGRRGSECDGVEFERVRTVGDGVAKTPFRRKN